MWFSSQLETMTMWSIRLKMEYLWKNFCWEKFLSIFYSSLMNFNVENMDKMSVLNHDRWPSNFRIQFCVLLNHENFYSIPIRRLHPLWWYLTSESDFFNFPAAHHTAHTPNDHLNFGSEEKLSWSEIFKSDFLSFFAFFRVYGNGRLTEWQRTKRWCQRWCCLSSQNIQSRRWGNQKRGKEKGMRWNCQKYNES